MLRQDPGQPRVMQVIEANRAQLAACPGHHWEQVAETPSLPARPPRFYVCTRCGGHIAAARADDRQQASNGAWQKSAMQDKDRSPPSTPADCNAVAEYGIEAKSNGGTLRMQGFTVDVDEGA